MHIHYSKIGRLTTVLIFSFLNVARIKHMYSGSPWCEDVDSDLDLLATTFEAWVFLLSLTTSGFWSGFVFPSSKDFKNVKTNKNILSIKLHTSFH